MGHEPKKIFLGTFEIARHLYDLADALRTLGHDVETGLVFFNPQHPDLSYDHRLDHRRLVSVLQSLQKRPLDTLLALPPELLFIRRLLTEFDVYIFQWGHSLLPDNQDLPILKALGKTVISIFNGSDTRHYSAADPFWKELGLTPRACHRQQQEGKNHLSGYLHRLRMAERYADAVFAQPSYAQLAVRPYRHLWLPMNLSLYPSNVPDRDVPVVVHAPSNVQVKGTDRILQVLDQLRDDGVAFELRLLQGVTNEEVIHNLVEADVVVDQLRSIHYGMLALEGMATGCAVAGSVLREGVPLPADLPIQHLDDENLYGAMKQLLMDRELRIRLAESGRALAERHHDHVRVAQHLLDCAAADRHDEQDYYPTYYACRYSTPNGESIIPAVQKLTAQVLCDRGLPAEADVERMVARGLAPESLLSNEQTIRRWNAPSERVKSYFWGSCRLGGEDGPSLEREALLTVVNSAASAASEGRHSVASTLLQESMERVAATPILLQDVEIGRALTHLADLLDVPELATALGQLAGVSE